jgi:hypothetical protein
MLHINFLPLESSTPRAPITEQLPLPFAGGHQQVRIPSRFLPDSSTRALRARRSPPRLDALVVAVLTGQRMPQPKELTMNDMRQRLITRAILKKLALESGASHV